MFRWLKTLIYVIVIVLAAILFENSLTLATPRIFKASDSQKTYFREEGMEIEIPVRSSKQEMSVEMVEPDLDGIRTPYGFRVVSKIYRFGPGGMNFASGKELDLRIMLGDINKDAKLYYINRIAQCLEQVQNQEFNQNTGKLHVKLRHFSDYVAGVTGAWDGNGLNPFMDYVHNGSEHISIKSLGLNILNKFYSVSGRGTKIDFSWFRPAYWDGEYHNCFTIAGDWYIRCIPYVWGGVLYLPNGMGYSLKKDEKIDIPIKCTWIKKYNDISHNHYYELTSLTLGDGTKISLDVSNCEIITDPNGNKMVVKFKTIRTFGRVDSIVDSVGRVFKFNYDDSGKYLGGPFLTSIDQVNLDGSIKQIFKFSYQKDNIYNFTDAKGLTTKYEYNNTSSVITKITYPNGVISRYSYKNVNPDPHGISRYRLSKHEMFYPGSTSAYKSTNYNGSTDYVSSNYITNASTRVETDIIQVTDSNKTKYYYYQLAIMDADGYQTKEDTYNPAGLLCERVIKVHDPHSSVNVDGFLLKKFLRYTCNSDGSLGTGTTYDYEYDDMRNITRIVDSNGNETRFAYPNTNSRRNLSSIDYSYPYSYQDYYFPNDIGMTGWEMPLTKATLVKDPVHDTTQLKQTHYKYDVAGNLVQESAYWDLQTYYTYDKYGNMLTKTDANGNQLCFEYDPKYQSAYLTRVTKADGTEIASFDYDFDTGNRIKVTDPKGNVFGYEYDAIGRLTKEYLNNSDAKLGITRQITYDDLNNTVALKFGNASAGWQEGLITYDKLFGKPTVLQRKVAGNLVTQKQFSYDSDGRLILEQDGEGHKTSYSYDALNRKVLVTQPDGSTTKYAYNDRTVTITDAKGNVKVETYDLFDRLASVKESPDSGTTYYTTAYTYDEFCDDSGDSKVYHLVKTVNPKNAAMTYTYDNLGRLVKTEYPQDSDKPMAAETFSYDNVGNLLTKTNGKGSKNLEYEFYAGYRLKKVTEPDGKVISYTYDANDNPLTQSTDGVTYNYTYDARNRVTCLRAQLDGYTFNMGYDYDAFGRITALSYPGRNAAVTYNYNELDLLRSIPGFVDSCKYDADNKLTAMTLTNGISNTYSYDQNDRPTNIGSGSLLNLNYSYDAVGNITQINSDYYGYDDLNRLNWYGKVPSSQKNSANGTIWSYDGAGNMVAKTNSQGTITFGYDKANRLLTMGTTTFTNDNAGARTEKNGTDTWSYTYDGESRLTQVNKNGAIQVQCAYDGAGMRYKKVENDKTTYYLYSGVNPLVEYAPADGKYTYRIYDGKQAVAEEKSGVVKFYHKDHLGSTRVVTDATGKKIAEYKYAPYGEKETTTGTGSDYQFTDKATDESSGLSYFGARFYDPEAGRFISLDPAKDGLNWYNYCNNNPVMYIDQNGLWSVLISFGIQGGVVLGVQGGFAVGFDSKCEVDYGYLGWHAETNASISGSVTICYSHDMPNAKGWAGPGWDIQGSMGKLGVGVGASGDYSFISVSLSVGGAIIPAQIQVDGTFSFITGTHDLTDPVNVNGVTVSKNKNGTLNIDYGKFGMNVGEFGVTCGNTCYYYSNGNYCYRGNTDNNSSSSSSSSSTGQKIICAELFRQGLMDKRIYTADEAFGELLKKKYKFVLIGYQTWARPVVKQMKKSKLFSELVFWISKPWTYEMAHIMGYRKTGDVIGKVMMYLGFIFCLLIGIVVVYLAYAKYLVLIMLIVVLYVKLKNVIETKNAHYEQC